MDTALYESGFTRTGSGRIRLIFGEFSQGIAHIVLDDKSVLHLHGEPGVEVVVEAFGSLQAARGGLIDYTTDALGVLRELKAA